MLGGLTSAGPQAYFLSSTFNASFRLLSPVHPLSQSFPLAAIGRGGGVPSHFHPPHPLSSPHRVPAYNPWCRHFLFCFFFFFFFWFFFFFRTNWGIRKVLGQGNPTQGNAGSFNPLAGSGTQAESSWILVGFLAHWATMGTFFDPSFHSRGPYLPPASPRPHPCSVLQQGLFPSAALLGGLNNRILLFLSPGGQKPAI